MSCLRPALPVLLLACGLRAPAAAQCEVGDRPGATLLFPYFEVDTKTDGGVTTLISVNNAATTAKLARVVLWTDWGAPELGFDIFLPGNAVQTINLRDVLVAGNIPSTGGLETFDNCSVDTTTHNNPVLPDWRRQRIVWSLQGLTPFPEQSPSICEGQHYADEHARGYITVDSVKRCNGIGYDGGATPVDATYFDTTATTDNVLWGDLIFVDSAGNTSHGVEAVALRAGDFGFGQAQYNTFYGHYVGGTGKDQRSPLPTRWAARFVRGGSFDGGTDVIVFRNPGLWGLANCGNYPVSLPQAMTALTVRDESGGATLSYGENHLLGLATQRVPVTDLLGAATTSFGRLDFDFNLPGGVTGGAWVIPVMTALHHFAVDFNAQPIDTGCGLAP
jgi:hypothetical protein